jgi:arylsulfatase A-like enzyme
MNANFISLLTISSIGLILAGCDNPETIQKPNIILIMADDHGWGDVGYNGNDSIITPHLDQMAAEGIRFNRFYSAAPVSSPTRGSCLTGRHPYRYGIYFANTGHMKKQELTLAEILKTEGYATGHFGKWHLGSLTKTESDGNRGGDTAHYSPPWENGFDICFSTESKVPTWNPMITPAKNAGGIGNKTPGVHYGTYYWDERGEKVKDNLDGDDSRVIMDRAIPFIESNQQEPFFAVIWFHTPHLPVVAGEKYRNMYSKFSENIQHYYGAITAMDEQIGRLRDKLKELGIEQNTMIFYTSDNGPEGKSRKGRTQGSTGGLKGRKRSLYEGGIRVPGLLVWPGIITESKTTELPFCTSDYLPTIANILKIQEKLAVKPIDGISMCPLINGEMPKRPNPIGFQSQKEKALINNRFKIYSNDNGNTFALYDIPNDPGETKNLADSLPKIQQKMQAELKKWILSCSESDNENDYYLN